MGNVVSRIRGAALASAAIGAVAVAVVLGGQTAQAVPATPAAGCRLANGVKHVIEITFDNVHFNRDNPNVLSDLEQIPALDSFITGNGTLLSNDHTPLIAHTADDTLTTYTGLYGDRQGQGISNDYETYNAGGTVTGESSFAYWTGTYGLDPFPNMPYSASVPAAGSAPATPPAPWVPFTRAGCNVGDVSTANMELENLNPDLQNVFGAGSPEVQQYINDANPYKDQEAADYEGLAIHCAKGNVVCADAQAVKYGALAASPTAVNDVLPDEPGGYSGYQVLFGHRYLQPVLAGAANAAGGVRTVGGHSYEVTNAAGNLVDLTGTQLDGQYVAPNPGFPGFGPISAAQSLAYVADMQEVGIPVTYAYISDAHESKPGQTGCSNSGNAQGPGDVCYQQTLAAYNQAFTTFFQRLAADGIDSSNTLFVFSSDEGDHFAGANVGRTLAPACTGTPDTTGYTCSYPAGTIGEEQVSIHGLLANQLGDTTPFYDEPQGNAVYITGNPGPYTDTTRHLERDFATASADDTYDGGAAEKVAQYEADPTVERLLHFVDADPNRTPSFTVFPKPDFYLTSGTSDGKYSSCAAGTTQANAASNCSSIYDAYAWNHGYYAPEINNNWLGLVGPGVRHGAVDGSTAGQGPSSAGTANSDPQPDTSLTNSGTWADETDTRPTIMALGGLKDDYVGDGRVLTEDLTIKPGQTGSPQFQPLAVCYKQLDGSVGEFGTDVLVADTAALKTGSSANDWYYGLVSAEIRALGAVRDALATVIKNQLYNAEFNNVPIAGSASRGACEAVLAWANALARKAPPASVGVVSPAASAAKV